jgi:DNA helicase-2/ATP-dependent DNA helicase PcrA
LDAANAVIGNNVKRKKKALWTDRGEGTKLHLKQFNTAREEAAFITDDIARKMRADRHLHYSDFAILYRTNAQARSLEERFVLDSIPYNVVGGTNFYDRREIRDMIAYLKTIDNGQDEIAVRRILNVPRRGIGATTMARLSDYAVDRDVTFFAAMESCRNITSLGRSTAKIESFVKLILSLREFAQEHRLSELLRQIIIQTEYEAYLRDLDDEDGEDRISNVDELVSKITDYEETAEEPTLSGFLEEVALVSDLDNTNESQDKVLLMTLHSAKGLEFPHVYITGMEDGIFPSAMALNSDDEEAEEEERRLAYVGITRAKDDLTLTCSRTRMLRGEVQYNPMSRFVAEIPEELFDSEVPSNRYEDDHPFDRDYSDRGDRYGSSYGGSTYGSISSYGGSAYSGSAYAGSKAQDNGRTARPRLKAVYKKPSTDDAKKPYIAKAGGKGLSSLSKGMPSAPSAPDYGPGDRVRHTKYGEGTVKAVEAGPRDYKVTVQFDEYGQKIMYASNCTVTL